MLGQDYRFNGTDIWMSISQQIAKFKTGAGKGKQFYLREICANPECLGMHILPHWQSHLAWSSLPERMRKDKSLMRKENWPSQAVGLQFYATALLQTPAPPQLTPYPQNVGLFAAWFSQSWSHSLKCISARQSVCHWHHVSDLDNSLLDSHLFCRGQSPPCKSGLWILEIPLTSEVISQAAQLQSKQSW